MPAPPLVLVTAEQPPQPVALAYGVVLERTNGNLAQPSLTQAAITRGAVFMPTIEPQ